MRRDLPSGTVTFLFTDVEGSTKLLEEIGDEAYDRALVEHRRVVRAASAAHGGVEVDAQGDAFFFAFPSARGAVAAAFDMTKALAPGPIHVRIGLHTGKPRVSEVDFSKATAELVDASVRDLGEHRLKDIHDPVSIYQLGDGHFPPLKTISNTNLPRPASSFIGRERELAEVLGKLEQGARLLTLTGPGGSGKTRLAIEAAATLVPEYKAGVFWVGLASLRDPALVSEQIAQTLGAKDGLAEHIGERELLLLLDNLEQVIEAAPEFSRLLQACPQLTLLCTSRELLRVQGEVEYGVPPLAGPEAVDLFCARSVLVPSEEISELCARLDNLPLAVELAAARTKALTPAQILERLQQRLDLLKGGRDADPRQQTLRATIAWSYDLLSEEEQRLLRSLSVFAGGCTLDAADEVAGADLDTLQSLVEKSLLRFSGERYWMLETVREFALEQLAASGDHPEIAARHAEYHLALAEEIDMRIQTVEQSQLVERLAQERDNMRAALARYIEHLDERALRLVLALEHFWMIRDDIREADHWFRSALLVSERDKSAHRAHALRQAGHVALTLDDEERAGALFEEALAVAVAAGSGRDIAASLVTQGHYEAGLQLFREVGDERGVAHALWHRGVAALRRGDFAQARQSLEEALEIYRRLAVASHVAWALKDLGYCALCEGNVAEAAALYREELAIAGQLASDLGAAEALAGLSLVADRRGDGNVATTLWRAAEEAAAAHGVSLQARWARLRRQIPVTRNDSAAPPPLPLADAIAYALANIE